jgi:hypothetical protein
MAPIMRIEYRKPGCRRPNRTGAGADFVRSVLPACGHSWAVFHRMESNYLPQSRRSW